MRKELALKYNEDCHNIKTHLLIDPNVSTRSRRTMYARACLFNLYRRLDKYTFQELGRATGYNHATIIHQVRQHDNRMDEMFGTEEYRELFNEIYQLTRNESWKQNREVAMQLAKRKQKQLNLSPKLITKPWRRCNEPVKNLECLISGAGK